MHYLCNCLFSSRFQWLIDYGKLFANYLRMKTSSSLINTLSNNYLRAPHCRGCRCFYLNTIVRKWDSNCIHWRWRQRILYVRLFTCSKPFTLKSLTSLKSLMLEHTHTHTLHNDHLRVYFHNAHLTVQHSYSDSMQFRDWHLGKAFPPYKSCLCH